jgi:hypothetical protein
MDQALYIPPPKLSGHPLAVRLFLPTLLVFIALAQVWIVSAGYEGMPQYSDNYSRLATGFLHGELGFLVRPSPQLLALPDPYDPVANHFYRWHDAVLYNGRYYLYWGPVPALLIAAVSGAIGDRTPTIGDQYLVIAFVLGTTVLAAILITQIRARFFPRQPVWSAALPILSLGLGTPVMYMLARGAVYEAAIASGQFFLMAGLVAAWFGLSGPRPRLTLYWPLPAPAGRAAPARATAFLRPLP